MTGLAGTGSRRWSSSKRQHTVRLCVRFMLSHRDVEDLLTERGPAVPHGTVRRWVLNSAPAIARRLRHRRASPKGRWRHEEMVVRIAAADRYVRRAVDSEDGGLCVMVERRRDNAATRKLIAQAAR